MFLTSQWSQQQYPRNHCGALPLWLRQMNILYLYLPNWCWDGCELKMTSFEPWVYYISHLFLHISVLKCLRLFSVSLPIIVVVIIPIQLRSSSYATLNVWYYDFTSGCRGDRHHSPNYEISCHWCMINVADYLPSVSGGLNSTRQNFTLVIHWVSGNYICFIVFLR